MTPRVCPPYSLTIRNSVFVFSAQSPKYQATIHFLTTKTEFVQMLFTLLIVVSGIGIEAKISSDNSKSKFGKSSRTWVAVSDFTFLNRLILTRLPWVIHRCQNFTYILDLFVTSLLITEKCIGPMACSFPRQFLVLWILEQSSSTCNTKTMCRFERQSGNISAQVPTSLCIRFFLSRKQ